MRMNRVPRMEEQARDAQPHDAVRRRKPPEKIPHTENEEYLSYAVFLFILVGFILACISLSSISWKVTKGSYDSFGVREVHMDGETHLLETMGLHWSVYTASRSALGFTIIGILFSFHAMRKTYHFWHHQRGTIVTVMKYSFMTAFWYLWAIMLYGCLFPKHPFQGDLYYYNLGSNFTVWSQPYGSGSYETQALNVPIDFKSLLSIQPHDHQLPSHQPTFLASLLPQVPQFEPSHLLEEHPLLQSEVPPLSKSQPSLPQLPVTSLSSTSSSTQTARSFPSSSNPSLVVHYHPSTRTLDNTATVQLRLNSKAGIPTFPSSTNSTTTTTTTIIPDTEEQQTQYFYSRTAWTHLNTIWWYGTGFWLCMCSAIVTLFWPVMYLFLFGGSWLYEQHKAHEVQQKFLVGPIALLVCAWLLAIIGFASRFWKRGSAGTDDHFGLDQLIIGGNRLPVSTYHFDEKGDRIHDSSATALAFGILGILSGCATWVVSIAHVYDAQREWLGTFVLAASTAGLWLIALIVYGAVFPHYIYTEYYEFGYSYWLVLCATIIYSLPFFAFVGWRIQHRAAQTTREERIMFLPVCGAILSIMFTMAALGSEDWCMSSTGPNGGSYENHLGLLTGRYQDVLVDLADLAKIHTRLPTAGMITLILLLCVLAIQTPVVFLGMRYVLGHHDICLKQMPLLNTALSISVVFIQLIAIIAYTQIIPWSSLPTGYHLSHSWRVEIVAVIFSLASSIGFGFLSHPPLPGEKNLLAEAVGR